MRPDDLHEIPLSEAAAPGQAAVTMSPGQWDAFLAVAYQEGFVLLELDEHETPIRAFRRSS